MEETKIIPSKGMMKLLRVILKVKAPKDEKARNYSYRDLERINENLKPILEIEKAVIIQVDESMVQVGDRYYLVHTSGFVDAETGELVATAKGWAREPASAPGQSEPQLTGTASTYARKRAVTSLLMLDNSSDDPDHLARSQPQNRGNQSQQRPPQTAGNQTAKQALEKALKEKNIPLDDFAHSGNVTSFAVLGEDAAKQIMGNLNGCIQGYYNWKKQSQNAANEDIQF